MIITLLYCKRTLDGRLSNAHMYRVDFICAKCGRTIRHNVVGEYYTLKAQYLHKLCKHCEEAANEK